MQAFRDGSAIFVTPDDFINMMESPYIIFDDSNWQYGLLSPWVGVSGDPLIHLPAVELIRIEKELAAARRGGGKEQ